jgi:sugar phosphate isomerase/epimerase
MKRINAFILLVCLCSICAAGQKTLHRWKLGVQAFTFHKFTFMETLDRLDSLGLHHVEVYFGQPLGEGFDNQTMDYSMDTPTIEKLKAAAKRRNVGITACGVVVCNSESEWEKLFDFAKRMGISLITCEPQTEHLDCVERLAEKYKIDVAIHNHPKPSLYRHPDLLMKALEGRGKRMGVCADVGHWKREGIEPVEALEKVSARLKSLHFKDIKLALADETPEQLHDVVWGTGSCNIAGMIELLKRIKFDGLMSIEYEYNWYNSVPDIRKCITNAGY